MGRPRKPKEIIKLEDGKFYNSRHQDRDGEPIAGGLPKKPRGLSKFCSKQWDFIVPHLVGMKVAKAADVDAIVDMCVWLEAARKYQALMLDDRTGKCSQLALNASKQWMNIAARFGLTPADRARIDVRSAEEKANPTKRHLA